MYAQNLLALRGSRSHFLVAFVFVCVYTQLSAESASFQYGNLECNTSTGDELAPEVSLGLNTDEDGQINLGINYSFRLTKKKRIKSAGLSACDEIIKLIKEKVELDNIVQRLEIEQLKKIIAQSENSSEGNLAGPIDDW